MAHLRTRRITRRVAAPLLAAGLAALACASPVPAAETKPVTIAIQYGYAYLPVVVAEKLGFFERQLAAAGASGRTAAIQKISGAPAINDAMISGTVNIGAYGLPGMLIAAEKTRGSINVRGLAALVAGVVTAIAEAQDYIRKEPRKAAEIFLASEKSSLTLDETEAMLKAASGEWGIQPQGVMRFATFMARNGLLKAAPANWQDVFAGPVVDSSGT